MIIKTKKILASAFILLTFMTMLRAQLDKKAPVISFLYKPITHTQNYLSMWRGWEMFAPNPMRINIYLESKVTFKDGTSMIWKFPRPSETNFVERLVWGERYRKYTSDGLTRKNKSYLWKDAAKFVLKKIAATHFRKKPVSVTLIKRSQLIPLWNKEFVPHRQESKRKYKSEELYTYKVEMI